MIPTANELGLKVAVYACRSDFLILSLVIINRYASANLVASFIVSMVAMRKKCFCLFCGSFKLCSLVSISHLRSSTLIILLSFQCLQGRFALLLEGIKVSCKLLDRTTGR